MEKDVSENFPDGLPERVAWRMATLAEKIQPMEGAFEAVKRRVKNGEQIIEDRPSNLTIIGTQGSVGTVPTVSITFLSWEISVQEHLRIRGRVRRTFEECNGNDFA